MLLIFHSVISHDLHTIAYTGISYSHDSLQNIPLVPEGWSVYRQLHTTYMQWYLLTVFIYQNNLCTNYSNYSQSNLQNIPLLPEGWVICTWCHITTCYLGNVQVYYHILVL